MCQQWLPSYLLTPDLHVVQPFDWIDKTFIHVPVPEVEAE